MHISLKSPLQRLNTSQLFCIVPILLRYLACLGIVLCLLCVGDAVAQSSGGPMTPDELLQSTPSTDESTKIFANKQFLGDFFKNPLSQVKAPDTVLGQLFVVFNAGVFIIGVLWVSYGVLSGIAQTAHSGQFLGQQMSAVWMPIRMVTGIVGIVPIFAGFSLSQVLLVTMAALGIGLANMMWSGALGVLSAASSEPMFFSSKAGNVSGSHMDYQDVADHMFAMHLCKEVYAQSIKPEVDNGIKTLAELEMKPVTSSSGSQYASAFIAKDPLGTLDKNCGGYTLNLAFINADSWNPGGFSVASVNTKVIQDTMWKSSQAMVSSMEREVGPVAAEFYAAYEKADKEGTPKPVYPSDKLVKAVSSAQKEAQQSVKSAQSQADSHNAAINDIAFNNMKNMGWMGAGAWYSTIAGLSTARLEAANSIDFSRQSSDNLPPEVAAKVNLALQSSNNAASSSGVAANTTNLAKGDESGVWDAIKSLLSSSLSCVNPFGVTSATGNNSVGLYMIFNCAKWAATDDSGMVNPITMFKNIGDYSLIAGQLMYFTGHGLEGKINIADKKNKQASDTSFLGIPVGKIWAFTGGLATDVAIEFAKKLATILVFLGPLLIIMGLMFGIYIPMVPFLVWMGGLVQYCVIVCQGLVGAPIAALAHLDSNGEGMGQRAEAGYMFLLNVTFRPALMLMGFFFASVLLVLIGTFQVTLFESAIANAQGNSLTGVASFFGYMAVFFMINLTLVHSLFNMIFLLPDQVLALVGSQGHMADLGKSNESETKAYIGSFNRTARDGLTAVSGAKDANKNKPFDPNNHDAYRK